MEDFIFGRYEVGCNIARSSNDEGNTDAKGKVQSDLPVYNYITKEEANTISERIYEGKSIKSRLCSSYAWDTALKFIGDEYAVNGSEGNYVGKGGLKNTGYYAEKNIYDMGGNVWEWTSELYNSDTYPYVIRRRRI